MRQFFLVLVALFLAIGVSSHARAADRTQQTCIKHVDIAWRADTEFTQAERDAIAAGFGDVKAFTNNRTTSSIAWDVDFNSTMSVIGAAYGPMIVRAQSWMKVVKKADAEFSVRYKRPVTVRAWTESVPLRIYFVVDRIPQLRQTASHELIHATGARRPNCDSKKEDCDHVPDWDSIMSAGIRDDVHTFSASDRAMCQASCLCP